MTDKPQHEFGVSRETDTEAPSDVSRETGKKPSRKSAVYLYLLVLFGAAFLMLLLAYFVQQRNNDATQEDLELLTASRQELMEDIQRLEQENDKLQKDVDLKQYATEQARELYEKVRQENREYEKSLDNVRSQLSNARILWYLERFINEKDYLMAACVVEFSDHYFNEQNRGYPTSNPPLPVYAARYLELRDWLEEHGHVGILVFTATEDGSDASQRPMVMMGNAVNASEEQKIAASAAKNLWNIINCYSDDPEAAAMLVAGFCDPEYNFPAYLTTAYFRSSTIALFQQIKTDLTERGHLIEADGIPHYAEDGKIVDIPQGTFETYTGG